MFFYRNDFRDLFVGIEDYVPLKNGTKVIPINFDNGATTPAFKSVEHYVNEYLQYYASIGRGSGIKCQKCTNLYERSREIILDFFNIKNKDKYTVIYVKNTTEGINLLANVLIESKDDQVLSTKMEHHANDLPWRYVAKVLYVDVDKGGEINISDIEDKLKQANGKIKFVTITGASNVTGFINPINKIASTVHSYGAKIIVDVAQLVAHEPIKMEGVKEDDYIDFLVFSAHKIYAPFGTGVVIGLKEELNRKEPMLKGGGAVDMVFDNEVYWHEAPSKFEAGTPNFLGVVALVAALKTINKIGFSKIMNHECKLRDYFLTEIEKIPRVIIYGNKEVVHRLCVIAFNMEGIYHEDLANKLAEDGAIAVRHGCFCAQPYTKRLLEMTDAETYKYIKDPTIPRPGMIRASLAMYNDFEEINKFLSILEDISKKC
ncbi:aminotransferase class V-fold PLP-dependent enzyme [Clostridium massiliamazoniense]|uniref:aminotransferase class V-fold PLP-dependent enzyme n=1 Tax=Clostridium massiliamazoniense TaxID=1347366 RepID=UPI0006D82B14|nr:aminotransferase class V-fold PLP-dependent enzyme [Clostridium massiliamazoniense]